ncbi:MAG: hypothetical protein HY322_13370 [Betaproteobacteria bacterium]|nr:hypothetical protein [Betaproteobacteria bacterium]
MFLLSSTGIFAPARHYQGAFFDNSDKVMKRVDKRSGKEIDNFAWFFTFGLVGLGMQITLSSIRQAGGQPLVIGSIVGVIKAVGSLIVVLLLVHETI